MFNYIGRAGTDRFSSAGGSDSVVWYQFSRWLGQCDGPFEILLPIGHQPIASWHAGSIG